ncbi:patatin-like phospholipase family protein [Congregibacter litoralis]|uniref:Putative esterase of the alpha-beta hydrolase superfamily n=1 Tax=Congregibacter litoralis KT71 TaxID=314285 RepID=A4A7J0_9GAMM|nr:patatin-like phospholipase family protein [Congregibacter litoralis]EAQ98259.1 putative esterase of the alpha-beta hydrolase superfamily [Congregibacter litoralis KT71]
MADTIDKQSSGLQGSDIRDLQDRVADRNATAHIVPVLAGGGARLPAHIGILTALEELKIDFRQMVGVSGGSIVAALFAGGYDLADIRQISDDTDFSQFLGQNFISLLRTGGLSSGDRFERWMDEKMQGRRFCDLAMDLSVVATDVRSGKAVIFNRDLSPEMRISEAVRYSMSVPLLFSFKTLGEQVMADGSILAEEALRRDWSGAGTPVVVFKLRGSGGLNLKDRKPVIPLSNYLAMLIHTFMTTLSHEYINEAFWLSTIVVETGDVSPVAFTLGPELKAELFEAGYRSTLDFLPPKLAQGGLNIPKPSTQV